MSKRWKVTAAAAVTALALAALPVMAQEGSVPGSNTNTATAGIFTTDVDNYMKYHEWSGVEFDQWFGFAGMANSNAAVGYARRFGGIYLGAYYNGRIAWIANGENATVKTETIDPSYNGEKVQDIITITTFDGNNTFYTRNNVNVLLGIAGMGIRVGFEENTASRSNPDDNRIIRVYEDGSGVRYDNKIDTYEYFAGSLTPRIGWGMPLSLGTITLKPWAEVALNFNQNRLVDTWSSYETQYGKAAGTIRSVSQGGVDNSFAPVIELGAEAEMSPTFVLGLKYKIRLGFYNSDYDVFGQSGTVNGRVTWDQASTTRTEVISPFTGGGTITEAVTLNIEEIGGHSHAITPSVYKEWELGDQVKLGFSAELPINIGVSTTESYTRQTTVSRSTGSDKTNVTETVVATSGQKLVETSSFEIEPNLGLGAQYVFTPDRLTLNAGINVRVLNFKNEVERTKPNGYSVTHTTRIDGYGNRVYDAVTASVDSSVSDVRKDSFTWKPFRMNASAGFTFFFTPKFALDSVFTTGLGGGDFGIDLTKIRVLFSIKN